MHYLILFVTSSEERYCISTGNFPKVSGWPGIVWHPPISLSLSLLFPRSFPLEFPFNCDTSSGLWRTAHPVISRHYPGMQGQVLPVQSMSARCTVLSPLSLSVTLSLSRCREDLPAFISVDLSCLRRNASFFPLACSTLRGNHGLADRDANHSIIVWPRRRKDQTGATSIALARALTRKYRVSLRNQFSLT